MKKQNNFLRRSLAALLAVVMCLGMVQVAAVAKDDTGLSCPKCGNNNVTIKEENHLHEGAWYHSKNCGNDNCLKKWGEEPCTIVITTKTPATCKAEGLGEKRCTICGQSAEVKLPIDPSNHVGDRRDVVWNEPTCYDKGNTDVICDGCGKQVDHEESDPLKPVFEGQEWVSQGASGHKMICKNCDGTPDGHSKIDDHHFGEWVIDESENFRTRTCKDCGYVDSEDLYSISVKYLTKDGKELVNELTKRGLITGAEETFTAPKIDGYKVSGNDTITVTIKGESESIVFYYEPLTYKVTVNYVDHDDTSNVLSEQVTEEVKHGGSYEIESPKIEGYEFADQSQEVVSGVVDAADVVVTILYKAKSYTLTVNFVYADGSIFSAPVVETVKYKENYSVNVPAAPTGYTADRAVVTGTMPAGNHTETVVYSRNPYTLTINYVINGQVVGSDTREYAYGYQYNVPVPVRAGYTADRAVVTGTMPAGNHTETVVYTLNTPETPVIPTPTDEPVDIPDPTDVPLGTPDVNPTEDPEPTDEPIDIIDPTNPPLGPGPIVPEDPDHTDAPAQNPNTPNTPAPGGNNTGDTEIEDEEVPLADAPKTGDDFSMIFMLMLASGCGLAAMGIKTLRRKEEN